LYTIYHFVVGYGDITPTTGGGRLLAVFIQFAGNLLLALPVGVIGANFVDLYALHEKDPPEKLTVIVSSDSLKGTNAVDYSGAYEISDEYSDGLPVYVLYDRQSSNNGIGKRVTTKKFALLYSEDRWKITYFGYRATEHFLACLKCPPGTTCYGGAAKPYVWVAATNDNDGNISISPAPYMSVVE
jgi:hypothetical protein